jgi:hypothetical protein
VKINFKNEFASGRLVFSHLNAELQENSVLISKYGVNGLSLWIGGYDAEGFTPYLLQSSTLMISTGHAVTASCTQL